MTTLTTHVSLGDIAAFGAIQFDDYSTKEITYDWELISAMVATAGSPFPQNRYGDGQIPHKNPAIQAVMVFIAPYGSNMIPVLSRDANPHIDVQKKVNLLVDKWLSVDPITGLAGHTDTLQIWDASHTHTWSVQAFLAKMPVKSTAGRNWRHVEITLDWTLLSPLTYVAP